MLSQAYDPSLLSVRTEFLKSFINAIFRTCFISPMASASAGNPYETYDNTEIEQDSVDAGAGG